MQPPPPPHLPLPQGLLWYWPGGEWLASILPVTTAAPVASTSRVANTAWYLKTLPGTLLLAGQNALTTFHQDSSVLGRGFVRGVFLLGWGFTLITRFTPIALNLPKHSYVSRIYKGAACLLLELLTCPVCRGGQLYLLIFRKAVTNLALLLLNTVVLANAFFTATCKLCMRVK